MIINSFDKLDKISQNKLKMYEESGYFHFERFTENQLDVYGAVSHTRSRSRCTSGICLDFCSDTDYIRLEYKILERARDWMYFDVYINDILVSSTGCDSISNDEGFFEFNVDKTYSARQKSPNRITIYLPHLCNTAIRNLQISDGAVIEYVPQARQTLLCLGDSITQGMESKHPSLNFAVQLSRHCDMKLINQGVGGYSFRKISLDPNIKLNPSLVVIAYGTNDWELCSSLEQFENNASGYISTAAEIFSGSRIVVLSPFWRSDMHDKKPCGSFFEITDAIKEICLGHPAVEFIDGLSLVPHLPELFPDGLHPNDAGFMHFTMNLIKALENKKPA